MRALTRPNRVGRIPVLLLAAALAACAAPSRIDTGAMTFSSEALVGKVVWNDLITEDVSAARRFYGELLGWTFEETTGPGGRSYVVARSGSMPVAGLVSVAPQPADARLSRWVPYLSVADVDDAAARAIAAGGRVAVEPRPVGLGRVAAIVDPQGAVIGLARSRIGDPDDATTTPGPGRRVWTEMLSNDPAASAAFYRSVIGYDARTVSRRGGEYTMLASSGRDRAGIMKNPTDSWSPLWLTSFGVKDVAAAAARAEALGGRVLLRPSPEVREASMAVVTDPAGAIVVLQEMRN